MKFLEMFPNQVGRLSTGTCETFAHGLRISFREFRHGNSASVPSKSLVGYPAPFSCDRGYPNPSRPTTVDNRQRPLRLKVSDISTENHLRSKWIHHRDFRFAKHQLWSYPHRVSEPEQHAADTQFNRRLKSRIAHENAVDCEQHDEHNGHRSPGKVALRPKCRNHDSSITDETI